MNRIFLLAMMVIMAVSCKKDVTTTTEPERMVQANFKDVFEAFWTGMNNNYVFWDIDKTDWDAIYRKYEPLFGALKLSKEEDHRRSVGYFKEILANISDGHLSIDFNVPGLEDSTFSPAFLQKKKLLDFHAPISQKHFSEEIPGRYLDAGYEKGDFSELPVVYGKIKGHILYFYLGEFALSNFISDQNPSLNPEGTELLLRHFFNDLEKLPAGITGIILDVRGNGGGMVSDKNLLLGRLTDKPVKIGSIRHKAGNGRLDYTYWMDAVIRPHKNSRPLGVPIVVLGDMYSASMAEMTVMTVQSLPNGKFVGERTWGAHGPITDLDNYNGGEFSTSFLNVYCAAGQFKYRDGKSYEGIGLLPDVEVKYDKAALQAGKDLQLERAITLIP